MNLPDRFIRALLVTGAVLAIALNIGLLVLLCLAIRWFAGHV